MVQQANIEEVVYTVVRSVKFFQLLESLDALHLRQLASSNVENAHIFEGSTNVTEAFDNGVVQLEILE